MFTLQGQLLIESQESILEKFLQGIMANKKRKSKYAEVKAEPEEGEEDLDDSKGIKCEPFIFSSDFFFMLILQKEKPIQNKSTQISLLIMEYM